jgi:hypothetical protein
MLGSTMTFLRQSDEVAEKMVEQGDLPADALEDSPTAAPVGNAAP